MRTLLVGVFFLALVTQPLAAQLDNGAHSPSRSEPELQQLRDVIASQSAELEATREQLRRLEQRMEALEFQVRAQGNPPPTNQIASLPAAPNMPSRERRVLQTALSERDHVRAESPATPSSINQDDTSESIRLANGKLRIGTLLYGDFGYYPNTGFGPQFTSQVNPPGPGNDGYSAFEVTRAYINLFFSPNDAVTFRLTPDLYRQIGAAPATKIGKVSAVGPNTDQGLPFRLKYAYVDFNTLLSAHDAFRKDKLTIGQQLDPVIEFEERLYGFRYVNIVPWDYLGYSSSWAGASLHGPVESNNKQYLDYSVGIYNNASYRLLEQSEKKHVAARLTVYPFGARWDYDGLGFTGFYDYGYINATPDSGTNIPIYRISALAHCTFKKNAYAIAGEFEAGRNSFTSGNFFSGSAPQDEFGLATTQYAGFDALVKALQNTNGAKQRGYALFGHAQVPRTPFSLFGMDHSFSPNVNVAKNPIDFDRIVAGIGYKVSDRLQFAISGQNLIFRHSQFAFPATELEVLSPSLATVYPSGIPNAVPNSIHAIIVSTGFNF